MATLTALKKKIAALEAQVERVTKAEIGNAIAKVRKLMGDYGLTIEQLADGARHARATVSKKSAHKKTAKASKSRKPAKYMDPKSGATWSGLGRIPAWIAKAKSRDAFLVDKPAGAETPTTTPATKSPAKRAATKKAAKAARPVESASSKAKTKKRAAGKKVASKKKAIPSTRAATRQAPAKKAAAKASRKTVASKKATAPAKAPAPAADAGASAN